MIAVSCYLHTHDGILHTDCCEIDTREDYPVTETERVLGQAVQVAMRAILRTIHARYKVQGTVSSEEIKDYAEAVFLAAAGKWTPPEDIEPVERPKP